MKLTLFSLLVFGFLFSFASQAAGTKELQEKDAVKQRDTNLEVSAIADKRTYKPGDRIKLEVMLINRHPVKDIFVYGHPAVWLPRQFHAFSSRWTRKRGANTIHRG